MDIGKINNNHVNTMISNTKTTKANNEFEQKLQNAVKNNEEKQLRKACQEFEGIFMNIMYKQMKATIIKSDLVPSSPGTEMFESMLDEELVNQATEHRSYGLADMLYKSLSKNI